MREGEQKKKKNEGRGEKSRKIVPRPRHEENSNAIADAMLSCLIIDIIRKADLHEDGFARDHTRVICFIFKKVKKIVSRFDEFETCLSP